MFVALVTGKNEAIFRISLLYHSHRFNKLNQSSVGPLPTHKPNDWCLPESTACPYFCPIAASKLCRMHTHTETSTRLAPCARINFYYRGRLDCDRRIEHFGRSLP